MKLKYYIHKSSLFIAIENENIEIVKLLLKSKNLDINITNV